MTPDLDSLRCFVSAATRLNFRNAAADVHLSPAALSGRIRQLEVLLGQELFVRTTRSVALTDGGKRLLPHAKSLLAAADACKRIVASTEALPFELTIGTRFELGMSWLMPAMPSLDAARPHRTLHVHFSSGADLARQVNSGELDAFITSSSVSTTKFEYEALHRENYVFVAASKLWPPARRRARPPTEQWCLLDTAPSLPLFRYLAETTGTAPWSFASMRYFGSIAPIKDWVLAGRGVAVLPHYYVTRELVQRRLIALTPPAKLGHDYFRLVWKTGHPRAHELRELAAELRALPLT